MGLLSINIILFLSLQGSYIIINVNPKFLPQPSTITMGGCTSKKSVPDSVLPCVRKYDYLEIPVKKVRRRSSNSMNSGGPSSERMAPTPRMNAELSTRHRHDRHARSRVHTWNLLDFVAYKILTEPYD